MIPDSLFSNLFYPLAAGGVAVLAAVMLYALWYNDFRRAARWVGQRMLLQQSDARSRLALPGLVLIYVSGIVVEGGFDFIKRRSDVVPDILRGVVLPKESTVLRVRSFVKEDDDGAWTQTQLGGSIFRTESLFAEQARWKNPPPRVTSQCPPESEGVCTATWKQFIEKQSERGKMIAAMRSERCRDRKRGTDVDQQELNCAIVTEFTSSLYYRARNTVIRIPAYQKELDTYHSRYVLVSSLVLIVGMSAILSLVACFVVFIDLLVRRAWAKDFHPRISWRRLWRFLGVGLALLLLANLSLYAQQAAFDDHFRRVVGFYRTIKRDVELKKKSGEKPPCQILCTMTSTTVAT